MFKEDLRLEEIRQLNKLKNDFQPVINFLQSGCYEGYIFNELERIEHLIIFNNENVLLKDSIILNELECFIKNMFLHCCNSGYGLVKLTDEELKEFLEISRNIIISYNKIINI